MEAQSPNLPNILHLTLDQIQQRYWRTLDVTVPHTLYRWLSLGGLFLLYMLRVWIMQGWYIVTYGLGIHILNLFIGFITPQVRYPRSRLAGRVRSGGGLGWRAHGRLHPLHPPQQLHSIFFSTCTCKECISFWIFLFLSHCLLLSLHPPLHF